jgi:hypothetical protein
MVCCWSRTRPAALLAFALLAGGSPPPVWRCVLVRCWLSGPGCLVRSSHFGRFLGLVLARGSFGVGSFGRYSLTGASGGRH